MKSSQMKINKAVKPKSFHLQWHITEKCNFSCRHCYSEGGISELAMGNLLIVLSQYIDLIKAWGLDKNDRSRKLTIGGGEPLLRSDFFRLLKTINESRSMFSSVGVMSNGSMISRGVAMKLKNYGVSGVQVSLEGMEAVNDKIRGKGSFQKALKGIMNLLDTGVPVGVAVTIHKENYEDFPNLLEHLEGLGVKSVGISRLVPAGRGARMGMLEPDEMRKFYAGVMALRKEWEKKGGRISTHCSDSLWFIEDANHETHGCSAGYDSFSILPNGDVVPCRRLPLKVGNVLEKNLTDIWYTSDLLWKLRNKGNIRRCSGCAIFGKCFGGARCVANGYFDNSFAPDPQCWKLFSALPGKMKFPSAVTSDTGNVTIFNETYVEKFNLAKVLDWKCPTFNSHKIEQ